MRVPLPASFGAISCQARHGARREKSPQGRPRSFIGLRMMRLRASRQLVFNHVQELLHQQHVFLPLWNQHRSEDRTRQHKRTRIGQIARAFPANIERPWIMSTVACHFLSPWRAFFPLPRAEARRVLQAENGNKTPSNRRTEALMAATERFWRWPCSSVHRP